MVVILPHDNRYVLDVYFARSNAHLSSGWFVLLTSLLGFYRVKRWERGILASQQATQQRGAPTPATGVTFMSGLEQNFALNGVSRIELLRQGLGLRRAEDLNEEYIHHEANVDPSQIRIRANELIVSPPLDPNDPHRTQAIIQGMQQDTRLRNSLRDAGFL